MPTFQLLIFVHFGPKGPNNLARKWRFLFKIVFAFFSPKHLAIFFQNSFWKHWIMALVLKKNFRHFAEKCRQSQTIVLITLTPDHYYPQIHIGS
jgi:hypothetical protein